MSRVPLTLRMGAAGLLASLLNLGLAWLWYGPTLFQRFWFLSHQASWTDIKAAGAAPWLSLFGFWLLASLAFFGLVHFLNLERPLQRLILALGTGLMLAPALSLWPLVLDQAPLGGAWVDALYWPLGLLILALSDALLQTSKPKE